SVIQKVWQGLGAIFRRPQKPGEARTVGKQSSAKPGVELAKRDSQQPRNAAEGTAEAMSVIETGQASLPVQPALKAALSSEPVQRFHENIGGRNGLDEPQMIAKSRARLSLAAEQEPVMEAHLAETNPSSRALETMIDLPDQAPESDHLPQQPVPLQAVWNVQRLEEPEIGTNQSGSFSAQDIVQHVEALAAQGTAGAGEPAARSQPIAPDRERQSPMEVDDRSSPPQSSFEGSRAPVEILPPSRPRPAGASVVPPRPAVQRQPENRHAAGELHEPTMVDTEIGPLPSDLWSLLGQKPPLSSDQRDVQRKTAVRPSSAESSSNQKTFLHEYTAAPAEKAGHTAHSPTVLQRQIESSVSSTGPEQDQASPSEEQEKASAEPDLHDLAQKVYAEVRRRLATESERTHRYV
ncbi:MAG TPA: hypothetical protein VGK56_07565, partial [Anaerolineales bacterium]